MSQITLAIVGAGNRGAAYARYALEHPDEAKVVAVAEPRVHPRAQIADAHDLPDTQVFSDWRALAQRERLADAVLITTPDHLHTDPALAFIEKGYHVLLEKPMAPTEAECEHIAEAAAEADVLMAVGHVYRYTNFTRRVKAMVDEGVIGEVVNIQSIEPVGYWHQAHSFVRGNWRNEAESSFMLLSKSCHDLDWIQYIMDARCTSVASFGTLKHFRREEKPAEAGDRCLDCAYEPKCPYSAKKLYLGMVERGQTDAFPLHVITDDRSREGVMQALRTGPYGRCVYECDNDVVDNQVVNLQFDGGQTASFTMVAFTDTGHRRTHIFGTRGEIYMEGPRIEHFDFLTDETRVINVEETIDTSLEGHGYGDYHLMKRFVEAVATNSPELILSGPEETLQTHRIVFAAERARREHAVVDL